MFIFNVPVLVEPAVGQTSPLLPIIGFLYSSSEHSPMFSIIQELYACYLLGMEKLISDGGRTIDDNTWRTGTGMVYNIWNPRMLFKIYNHMRTSLQYKLYEFSETLKYTDEEVKDGLILKSSLLDRYGVSFIQSIDINKLKNRYEEDVRS